MSGKPNKYAGTKTEKNLEAAFAGESQARNKYTYFAQVAEKEGMEQIAELFLKSADNEKVHAKMWLRELGGINGTLENLSDAADGENHEWTSGGGGLHPAGGKVQRHRHGGEAPRGTLSCSDREYQKRRGLPEERDQNVGVPLLRPYPYRQKGAEDLPHVRRSPGVL